MKIFGPNESKLCPPYRGAVAALGFFDGVHLGHMQLINEAMRIAREKNAPSMVYTFNIPPKNFGDSVRVLEVTPVNIKSQILSTIGLDALFIDRFDEAMKGMTDEEFVRDVLSKKLGLSHVVVGFNYRFGKRAMSGGEELIALCERYNIGVTQMPPYLAQDDVPVSSTLIRGLLSNGEVEYATKLLNRPFFIVSRVIRGQQIGSSLDVKTINQEFIQSTITPKTGVYISRTTIDGATYKSMTNVGTRPTVNENNDIRAETHIIGFNLDVYGEDVKVEFLARIRDEKKFGALDELKAQLLLDTQTTLSYFEKNHME